MAFTRCGKMPYFSDKSLILVPYKYDLYNSSFAYGDILPLMCVSV